MQWRQPRSCTGFTDAPERQATGTFVPIAGDFDGSGQDDVHWYRPGPGGDRVWWSSTSAPLGQTTAPPIDL